MTTRVHYRLILEAVEAFTEQALKVQVADADEKDRGGFRCPERLISEPWATANIFSTFTTLYLTQDSKYHRSEEIKTALDRAIDFLGKSQHQDGTISGYFSEAGLFSPPTAFASLALMRAYNSLNNTQSDRTEFTELTVKIKAFLDRAIEGITKEALFEHHHRFVVVVALMEFDRLFPNHLVRQKAEAYLSEGLDINDDGTYRNESPSFSIVANTMLMAIAQRLGNLELLENVRDNLDFQLHSFHSNGEVATQFSPNKTEIEIPTGYALWKRMSIIDQNGTYAATGDMVLSVYLQRLRNGLLRTTSQAPTSDLRRGLSSRLFATSNIGELLSAELQMDNDWVPRLPMPDNYEEFYPTSNIARFRSGKLSATIMGHRNNIFSLRNGNCIIDSFRIGYVYNGFREVALTQFDRNGKTYLAESETLQWVHRSSHKKRAITPLELKIFVEITSIEKGFELQVFTKGWAGVPLQLELGFEKRGIIMLDGVKYDLADIELIFAGDSPIEVINGDEAIELEGGITEHKIYNPRLTDSDSIARLLITPVTPYSGKLRIRCR